MIKHFYCIQCQKPKPHDYEPRCPSCTEVHAKREEKGKK